MRKRRNAVVAGIAALCLVVVPAAWADDPGADSPGHQTATVSCSGGSGFVVDANALFGQQTETAAFNAAPPEETCEVNLDTP
jgi:Spy/CpxP family protein refolding chaperone